jgi:hypothetical protein
LDPDIKNCYGSGFGYKFGSDPKHSLFHNANDFKWLFIIDLKANFQRKC